MTKSAADFAERNTERAVQVTNYGMDWLREVAEQNLDQSKASAETLMIATRKAVHALPLVGEFVFLDFGKSLKWRKELALRNSDENFKVLVRERMA